MSALSDLINKGLTSRGLSGWSLRTLAVEIDERLSHGSIAKYRNGTHGVPDEETLDALSDLTGISVERLRRAAGLPAGQREIYQPPVESARLDRRQRLALDELIRSIVIAQEVGNASQESGQEARGTQLKESTPIGGAVDIAFKRSARPAPKSLPKAADTPRKGKKGEAFDPESGGYVGGEPEDGE